jgi:hypothetical protein
VVPEFAGRAVFAGVAGAVGAVLLAHALRQQAVTAVADSAMAAWIWVWRIENSSE